MYVKNAFNLFTQIKKNLQSYFEKKMDSLYTAPIRAINTHASIFFAKISKSLFKIGKFLWRFLWQSFVGWYI